MAVEVSTNPMPATNATAGGKPSSTPTPVSSAPHSSTCITPSPKICLRSAHSRLGSISSPTTNRTAARVRISEGRRG